MLGHQLVESFSTNGQLARPPGGASLTHSRDRCSVGSRRYETQPPMSYDEYDRVRAPWLRSPFLALGLALLATALAATSFVRQQRAIDAANVAQLSAKRIERELGLVHADNDRLAGRIRSTERELRVTGLAGRAKKSVFTIVAGRSIGTAFAAWRTGEGTFFITANHVVAGWNGGVTIQKKKGIWDGDVVRRDPGNDLALVLVEGRPEGAAPLWQKRLRAKPKVGDRLLLVGSPYGLGGTVTTGIVSRVTPKTIQTDAAANPGNSGGPAVDRKGRVVGVLVSGGGQNINFAVRIERACAKLRRC
jgi:S1-C subfamily serine protease